MKKLFGTDGIRHEAGKFPLDEKTISIIGTSLTNQFKEKLGKTPRFVSGRDTRQSGSWIEKAFHAGVKAAGGDCQSAEIITTPGVAYITKTCGFDAGIVISASHNPFQDNGLKIFSPNGKKIDDLTERRIEEDIFNSQASQIETECQINDSQAVEFQEKYLSYLADEFKELSLEKMKIVIDCANGAGSNLAPRLFAKFGAETVVINNQPDGLNINLNCGSTQMEGLINKVIEEKADFGVAFDGDADRSLFVDENGTLVDGDATLWVIAQHLKERRMLANNTVIATVMSNIGLEIALNSIDVKLSRTAVGDKYVLEELLKTNSDIGGEQSGHIIFPFRSLVGDGMLTTLFLLETLFEKQKTLSEMTAGFKRFPQVLINVKVQEKKPFAEVPKIAQATSQVEAELGTKGRLLLRYSGTENLARVMIEGEHQETIETQAKWLANVLQKELS